MKALLIFFVISLLSFPTLHAQTWSEWFSQKKTQKKYLEQQIIKLQLYLSYAKDGYNIARDGLTLIGNIKNGDFGLHLDHFGHLSGISPAIAEYSKVADIILIQLQMISTFNGNKEIFRQSGVLTATEFSEYQNTFSAILQSTDDDIATMTNALSPGSLSMTDKERIDMLDKIYSRVSQASRAANGNTTQLAALLRQRKQSLNDLSNMLLLY